MNDSDGLKFVVAWSLGGIVASALVLGALISLQKETSSGDIVTERSLDRLDEQTCQRMMQTFIEQSHSGARIIWLWAEESSPRLFGSAMRTKQVVEATNPPRPYAFHPTTQAVPAEACSFPSNSLHVVSIEPDAKPDTFISDRIE